MALCYLLRPNRGTPKISYRIWRVDGSRDDITHHLCVLHEACFGTSAPQVCYARGDWWVVTEDKSPEIIGFAGLTKSPYSEHFGYLKRSGVLPAHRGHGLQRRLIRVREGRARKLGWSHIITDTTDNPASANTLIRAGYRLFRPRHPWGPLDETLYWKKTINGERL